MRNCKKAISISIICLFVLFLVVGCSSSASDTKQDGSQSSETAQQTEQSQQPSGQTYTFTYATVDAQGSEHDKRVESALKQLLEDKSGGRMTLQVYYSASLTGVGSTLDGIKNGTVDMGYDACPFYVGQFPYIELFSTPGINFGNSDEATAILLDYINLYHDSLLDDYKVMANFCGEVMCAYSTGKPITDPADMKGMTFRATGANSALIEAAGGAATSLPSSEVYESLRLNVIDGSISNFGSLITFNFGEVTKSCTRMPILTSQGTVFMSKELYESMPAEDQAIIDEVCVEFQQAFMDFNEWNDQHTYEYVEANLPDFEVVELSDEALDKFTQLAMVQLENKAKALDELGLDGSGALEWLKSQAK